MAGGVSDPTLLILEDAAPPAPSGLVDAIDVSSNNGLNIGPLIDRYKPAHVIVKCYQRAELSGNGAAYSIHQAAIAEARGCSVGGYGWLFGGIDGARQAGDFIDTARRAGIGLGPTNPLWLDCETYQDDSTPLSWPNVAIIRQAVEECRRRGVPCGIYSGQWFWTGYLHNPTEFKALPLWDANYVSVPRLVAPTYGGWTLETLAGTQWSGNPVDRSVFKAQYATEGQS